MFIHVITGTTTDAKELERTVREWVELFRPGSVGFLGSTCGISDRNRFVEVACFESEAAAHAIREAPEIDEWRAAVQNLYTDLAIHDATEIFTIGKGWSEDAGFVQIIRASIVDPDRLASLLSRVPELEGVLAKARPDVLGQRILLHADGTCTQAVYFTSEEDARRNERAPLPAEARALFDELMAAIEVNEYIDLPDPWLFT